MKKSASSKGDKVATEGFVIGMAETILEGVEKLLDEKLESQEKRIMKGVNTRFDKQDVEIKWIKHDLNDQKRDSVSQQEFSDLKKKVYRHHPVN